MMKNYRLLHLLFPVSILADWQNSLEEGWKNTKEATSSYYEKASEAIKDRYINQLKSVYITNTHRIMAENAELISKTTGLFENATGTHRNLYQRNLKAQTYTQDVANLYAQIMTMDLKKVQ